MPPLGQTPGHLTFLKNLAQIPRNVASLDGPMPHPLELHRASNPPPSRHVKANCGNKFCKIFNHYEFQCIACSSLHSCKQRQIPRLNYVKRQQQKSSTWNRQEQWPGNAAHLLNHRIAIIQLLPNAVRRFWHESSNAPTGGPHLGSHYWHVRSFTRVQCLRRLGRNRIGGGWAVEKRLGGLALPLG